MLHINNEIYKSEIKLLLRMSVVFYSWCVCISAYANAYFKTILRECLRARLPSGSTVLRLHLCSFRLCSARWLCGIQTKKVTNPGYCLRSVNTRKPWTVTITQHRVNKTKQHTLIKQSNTLGDMAGAAQKSILAFHREARPTLRYFPNDTELALGMTLLELHYIIQGFCVHQKDGGGVNRGS